MNSGVKASASAGRILHINSPAQILRFVESFCESKGIKVDSTDSESLAFHHALLKKYKLIMMGLGVPKIDAARILGGLVRFKLGTPVLLVSATPIEDEPKYTGFQNVLGVIAKPINVAVLSQYLQDASKPPEFTHEEKNKFLSVLEKWETELKQAN